MIPAGLSYVNWRGIEMEWHDEMECARCGIKYVCNDQSPPHVKLGFCSEGCCEK